MQVSTLDFLTIALGVLFDQHFAYQNLLSRHCEQLLHLSSMFLSLITLGLQVPRIDTASFDAKSFFLVIRALR